MSNKIRFLVDSLHEAQETVNDLHNKIIQEGFRIVDGNILSYEEAEFAEMIPFIDALNRLGQEYEMDLHPISTNFEDNPHLEYIRAVMAEFKINNDIPF